MAAAEKILKVIFAADSKAVDKAFASIDSHSSSLQQRIGKLGHSMTSAGKTMTMGLTLPILGGLFAADVMAEKNAATNRLLERSLVSAGMKGSAALRSLGEWSAKLGEKIGVSEIDLKTLEGRVISMGHSFFAAIGPAAAGKDIRALTLGMENLSAASGKSISMLMRSLAPSILNAPEKAAASLTKFGVLTQKQTDHIKEMVKAGHGAAATQIELNALMGANAGAAAKAATPLAKLRATLEHVGIVIGTIVMPYVQRFVAWIGTLAAKFQGLSPHVQKMIVVAGLLLAALGPVLVIVGTLAVAIGAISLPILAAIAVTALLAFEVYKHWGAITAFIHKHAKAISQVIHLTWAAIKLATKIAWTAIQLAVIHPIQMLVKIIIPIVKFIADHWKATWQRMKDVFSGVWNGLVAIARGPLNLLIGLLNLVISALDDVIHGFNMIPGVPDIPPIPHIPKLAAGTASFAGGLALVGERGPELVGLGRGAAVLNAGSTRQVMGGAGINVVVHVHGSVSAERDLAQSIRRELIRAARNNSGRIGLA